MTRKTEITSHIKGCEELNIGELRNLYYQAILKMRYQETNWFSHRINAKSNASKVSTNEYNRIPFHCYSNTIMMLYVFKSKADTAFLDADVFNLQAYDMTTGNEITEVTLTKGSGVSVAPVGRDNGANVYLHYTYVALKFDASGTYTNSDGILNSKMCTLQINDKYNRTSYSVESKLNTKGYFRFIEVFPGLTGYATINENEVISGAFLNSLNELMLNKVNGFEVSANRISNYLLPMLTNLNTPANNYDISAQYGTVAKNFLDGYYNAKIDGTNYSTQKIAFCNSLTRANYTFSTYPDEDNDFAEGGFQAFVKMVNQRGAKFKDEIYSDSLATVYSDTPTKYKWKEWDLMRFGAQVNTDGQSENMVLKFNGNVNFTFLNFGLTQFLEGYANTYQLDRLSQFWRFAQAKIAMGETPIDNITLSLLLNTFKTGFWQRNIDVVECDCDVKYSFADSTMILQSADYTANVITEADLGFFCELIYADDGSTYDIDIPSLDIYINFKSIY